MVINVGEVVSRLIELLRKWGQVDVEDYGDEKVVIVGLSEDFSVYVSIVCSGGECSVEYAIGDDNFAITPTNIVLLDKAVAIIKEVNEELAKEGVVK